MKNILLPLLVAGVFGCAGTPIQVEDPYYKKNGTVVFQHGFENILDESCLRSVYLTLEDRSLTSLVLSEHCVPEKATMGHYWTVKYTTDSNGKLAKECVSSGYTGLGFLKVTERCIPRGGTDWKMQDLLAEALTWAKSSSIALGTKFIRYE